MRESANPLVAADYTIIAGYFAVMLAIGFYFSDKMHDIKDYFGGGKQVPWWLSGISFYMTTFSASSFVSYSALAYQYGWVSITIWWLIIPTMLISARFFAIRWRRVATTSPLEFIEDRYGMGLRQGLSWLGSVYLTIDDGLKIFAISTLLSTVLGFPLKIAIISCGIIMLTYTILGGLWAVLVTDFVQFIVLLAVVIVLVPLTLARIGGLGSFVNKVPEGFFSPTAADYTWVYLGLFILLMLLDNCTRWSLVQRYYSVRKDSDARQVGYLVAALHFIGPPLLFFPAMAASLFLPGVENPDHIYGLLCRDLLPVGLLGLLIAAMFSATMSMLSSDYNAVASVLTTDIYKRLFARSSTDRSLVISGRLATFIVGSTAIGIAMIVTKFQGSKNLFDVVVSVFSTLSPPLTIPIVMGLVSRRVSNAGAMSGFSLGICAGLIARFIVPIVTGNEIPETILMSTSILSTVFGIVVGTILSPGSPEKQKRIKHFLDGVESMEISQETNPALSEIRVSPAPIIGTAVGALGALLILVMLLTVPVREAVLSLVVGCSMLAVGCIFIVLPRLKKYQKS